VLYRDLKPENVLLDARGYVRLVDFGLAREVGGAADEPGGAAPRSRTLCGTPEYLSPEMVAGAGYSFPNDCWALGIVAFELANGYTPFNAYGLASAAADNDLDPALCRRICSDPVRVRKTWDDPPLTDLVLRLLEKDPAKRATASDACAHPSLAGFEQSAIVGGAGPPPFRPALAESRGGAAARGANDGAGGDGVEEDDRMSDVEDV